MNTYDYIFWHNPYEDLWYAIPRDQQLDFFNGNRDNAKGIWSQIIKNHLKLVFLHEIDPSYSDNKVVQQIFQNIHDGKDPLLGIQGVSSTTLSTNPSNVIVKC